MSVLSNPELVMICADDGVGEGVEVRTGVGVELDMIGTGVGDEMLDEEVATELEILIDVLEATTEVLEDAAVGSTRLLDATILEDATVED